ncbi:MAG: RNA polymerase subunit sigma-24 [Phototrophicales bacterium]|nr:MAG: RNA polymerase subunit sigma-24 [Phototrophicales bacterium]RMG72310.1 MAG: sigma-70 family RNA polymerase sigma factor [Chloroflexota bacterium]
MSEADPIISQWVYAAMQNNQDAFAEIVYTFQDAVYNLCYRMLGNHVEAEDASQEAFLKAFGNLSRYDHGRSFKTWLLTIASNHCIDRLRKRRMQYISIDEPIPATLALSSEEALPEEVVVSDERSEQIQALLNQLKPDDRAVVVFRYWYDYSYAEIADMMETTESAVKSRLFRARKALATLFEQTGDTYHNSLSEGYD